MAVAKNTEKVNEKVDEVTGEIVVFDDSVDTAELAKEMISSLNKGSVDSIFSTLSAETFDEKANLLKAVTDSEPIVEHLGEVINLTNYIVQTAEFNNEDSDGNLIKRGGVIVTLIDDQGNAYRAASMTIVRSLNQITGIMGHPSTWDKPLGVKVQQKQSGVNRYYVLVVA